MPFEATQEQKQNDRKIKIVMKEKEWMSHNC